jgi:hypothetical protein
MTDAVDQVFKEYIAAHRESGAADPLPFLERIPEPERPELIALIEGFLARAPRREWDAAAYEASAAPALVDSLSRSLRGQAGLWPSLLPRLRDQARIKRADLVAELASRLGANDKREKVAGYYHQMEQGSLPADGVSDTVLDALGTIVGQSRDALRRAGAAFEAPDTGEMGSAQAFARVGAPADEIPPPASPGTGSPAQEDFDEVDRLFRSG